LRRPETAATVAWGLFFPASLKATLGSSVFSAIVTSLFTTTFP
jgi:hypothetical protein